MTVCPARLTGPYLVGGYGRGHNRTKTTAACSALPLEPGVVGRTAAVRPHYDSKNMRPIPMVSTVGANASTRTRVLSDQNVEHDLHERFAACHVAGEWFAPGPAMGEWLAGGQA